MTTYWPSDLTREDNEVFVRSPFSSSWHDAYERIEKVILLNDAAYGDPRHDKRWLAINEYGISYLIIAPDFDSAYEEYLDNTQTIDTTELPEAYGLSDEEYLDLLTDENSEFPELVEGYSYQPNATGTGIVWVGHYFRLFEF